MPEVQRKNYLRAAKPIDQRHTAYAIERLADWLDLADSASVTSVYPDIWQDTDKEETSYAWMWAALLIADMTEADSHTLRMLATAILLAYKEETNGTG